MAANRHVLWRYKPVTFGGMAQRKQAETGQRTQTGEAELDDWTRWHLNQHLSEHTNIDGGQPQITRNEQQNTTDLQWNYGSPDTGEAALQLRLDENAADGEDERRYDAINVATQGDRRIDVDVRALGEPDDTATSRMENGSYKTINTWWQNVDLNKSETWDAIGDVLAMCQKAVASPEVLADVGDPQGYYTNARQDSAVGSPSEAVRGWMDRLRHRAQSNMAAFRKALPKVVAINVVGGTALMGLASVGAPVVAPFAVVLATAYFSNRFIQNAKNPNRNRERKELRRKIRQDPEVRKRKGRTALAVAIPSAALLTGAITGPVAALAAVVALAVIFRQNRKLAARTKALREKFEREQQAAKDDPAVPLEVIASAETADQTRQATDGAI